MEEVISQEWKESILGYFFLLHYGPAAEGDLDDSIEEFLEKAEDPGVVDKQSIDFDCSDALEKLEEMGLVKKMEKGRVAIYKAVPLPEAREKLSEIWNAAFLSYSKKLKKEKKEKKKDKEEKKGKSWMKKKWW